MKKSTVCRRILHASTLLCLCLSAATVAFGIWVRVRFETELPADLPTLSVNGTPPTLVVYRFRDRTNRIGEAEVLTEGVPQTREGGTVCYEELPDALVHAFVAIEDKRFFSHRGVDWIRTAAACRSYFTGGSGGAFGASTITQQTVKNLTGESEVTLRRKVQEILCARDLERLLDKSEIMELYVNIIPFANGCTGVAQAAEFYFGKAVCDLSISECAAIAAITNNPTYYDPLTHPTHTLSRRDLILSEMCAQGYLTEEEYAEAVAEPLRISASARQSETVHSWYVDMVLEDVISDLAEQAGIGRAAASAKVLGGGVRIEIAMDPDMQSIVADYYRNEVRTPINADGVRAQSSLIVIDPRTGDILAVAGAVGEKTANRVQNFATQTRRPPGSAIKPLSVYAPALEEGLITWSSVFEDSPLRVGDDGTADWPKNADGVYRGPTDISYAVAHSTNTVALRVLERVGLRRSFDWAKARFHLESLIDRQGASDCDVAALGLGQLHYGVTLRELTAAYTVFADAGTYHAPRSYYRVLDADGTVLLSCPDSGESVLSEENAAIMTKLLEGVVRDGTSAILLGDLSECAGKTGTTQDDGDRLFVGFTPGLVCGVWCGYEYPEPVVGRNLCTGIWNDVMRRILSVCGGGGEFDIPSEVVQLSYCLDSGALCTDGCLEDARGARTALGWFVVGTEPTAPCNFAHIRKRDGEPTDGTEKRDFADPLPTW